MRARRRPQAAKKGAPEIITRISEFLEYETVGDPMSALRWTRNNSVSPKVRDEQFDDIAAKRESFTSRGAMTISFDTKKKELVGCFKNNGQAWSDHVVLVNDHDFRSQAEGMTMPYGIFELQANRTSSYVWKYGLQTKLCNRFGISITVCH